MAEQGRDFPDDKTAPERRKGLTERELKELKQAGGVEGGMEAGSGGPKGDREGASSDKRAEDANSRRG